MTELGRDVTRIARLVKQTATEAWVVLAGAREVLDELKVHGIPTGDTNLPDWEETREGFQELLRSLFQVTPPTALLLDEEGRVSRPGPVRILLFQQSRPKARPSG